MVEIIEDEGELIGVEVRNTHFIKINGLTWEEVQDTFNIMRTMFERKGYLYLREANKMFKEKAEVLKNEALIAENQSLRHKLNEKQGAMAPKTIGK